MSGGIEGVGEAVTGAMLAGAVEPRAGNAAGHGEPGRCLNCGTALSGDYCHGCGQPGHVHRTLSAWWHDFLHSVLHLDGKMWRTLPLLALRPGELTRRYVEGERARFVSPLALFLFSVFLMFAVMSIGGGTVIGNPAGVGAEVIEEEIREAQQRLDRLEVRRREAAARGADTRSIERRMNEAREERDGLQAARRLGRTVGAEQPKVQTGWARLDRGVKKAAENPTLFFYKVQTNAYKFSWALIPLSVPFLWLLFLHRRRYRREYGAYDHTVFVTYSISFMSLGLVALVLLNWIGIAPAVIALSSILIPPVHIYLQLKGAYRLRTWSAVWRTAALVNLVTIPITLFLILLLALGALG